MATRVLVAKPGLDGHDRGAKTITRALRDHGFEVIYTGLHQTAEQIAETTLQEDADAVGLSLLSGAHLTLFPRVMQELHARDLDEVLVFGGGVIPEADARTLRSQGVASHRSSLCWVVDTSRNQRFHGARFRRTLPLRSECCRCRSQAGSFMRGCSLRGSR